MVCLSGISILLRSAGLVPVFHDLAIDEALFDDGKHLFDNGFGVAARNFSSFGNDIDEISFVHVMSS